jgi:hypothetical protein
MNDRHGWLTVQNRTSLHHSRNLNVTGWDGSRPAYPQPPEILSLPLARHMTSTERMSNWVPAKFSVLVKSYEHPVDITGNVRGSVKYLWDLFLIWTVFRPVWSTNFSVLVVFLQYALCNIHWQQAYCFLLHLQCTLARTVCLQCPRHTFLSSHDAVVYQTQRSRTDLSHSSNSRSPKHFPTSSVMYCYTHLLYYKEQAQVGVTQFSTSW